MKKKVIIIISLALFFCFSELSAEVRQKKRYDITGHIVNLPDGVTFYMIRSNHGMADTISQVLSKKGVFNFKGSLDQQGETYFIKMDTSSIKIKEGRSTYITLFLDNSNIKVSGDFYDWPVITLKGSRPTEEYFTFISLDNQQRINKEFLDKWQKDGADSLVYAEKKNKYERFLIDYAMSHPDSYVSPYCIFNASGSLKTKDIETVYSNLTPSIKESFYGQKIKDRISSLKNRSELALGKIIPDFFIETLDNKKISIREIAKQSDYTLIDFWAWWCVPCRKDVPGMKKVYEAFRDKGFTILSISTDPNKIKWKKAIDDDKTLWLHGMEVDNASKVIFNISSIPAYILVNNAGEMIAVDCGDSGFSTKDAKKYSVKDSNGKSYDAVVTDENDKGLRENLYEVIQKILGK